MVDPFGVVAALAVEHEARGHEAEEPEQADDQHGQYRTAEPPFGRIVDLRGGVDLRGRLPHRTRTGIATSHTEKSAPRAAPARAPTRAQAGKAGSAS